MLSGDHSQFSLVDVYVPSCDIAENVCVVSLKQCSVSQCIVLSSLVSTVELRLFEPKKPLSTMNIILIYKMADLL